MNRRKRRPFCWLLLLCLAVTGLLSGCGSKFDARGYTKALLDLNFQGETAGALEYVDGVTKEDLMQQYQAFIDQFVETNIASGLELPETKRQSFAQLVSTILTTMRYDVKEAKESGKREYEVPVSIWPTDLFEKYQELLVADSLKIAEKVREGGYVGTEEEVNQQMLGDIINHSYELLDAAFQDQEYQEEETVILHVRADKKNEYFIDEDDMNTLILKILKLDEIGG